MAVELVPAKLVLDSDRGEGKAIATVLAPKFIWGSIKKRPGPARASISFSPGFHPGSVHTRDVPINQYEISNHKPEIPFPPYATPISPATCGRGHISHH